MIDKFLLRLLELGVDASHGLPLSIRERFSFVVKRGGFFMLNLTRVVVDVTCLRTDGGVFGGEIRNTLAVVDRSCVDLNHLFDLVL